MENPTKKGFYLWLEDPRGFKVISSNLVLDWVEIPEDYYSR